MINNIIRDHVEFRSISHRNCIKINIGDKSETRKKHEIRKAIDTINDLFEGKTVFTECYHIDTKRISDRYIVDDNKIVEIANSESDESIEEKRKEFERLGYTFEYIRI